MNVRTGNNGNPVISLIKAETRRILEAKYIIQAIHGTIGEDEKTMKDLTGSLVKNLETIARCYGEHHMDSAGRLRVTGREAAVLESAPTA